MNKQKKVVAGGPWQRVSFKAVFREAEAVLPLVEQHGAALGGCGWTRVDTRKLQDELETLRAVQAERLAARSKKREATAAMEASLKRVQRFRTRICAAVTLASRAGIVGADPRIFTVASMGQGSGETLSWLAQIRGPLRRIDERLHRGFYPRSAAQEHEEVAREYTAAVRASDAARRELRERSARVGGVRRSIGALLSQLRLAVRVAFADDAATRREFLLALKAARRRQAVSGLKAA